ncbi:MAG: FHA domain-containing protein [Alistipes sp.]|nr:FHA domain-containing protein [Alistipes sp.]
MKKFLTIGRDSQCDICIVDNSDVVSRQHAILEVGGGGKYYITDKSRNGTYVNGIKIAANERVPVTRKDIISLAHVQELNWDLVPKDNSLTYAIVAVGALVVLALVLFFTLRPSNSINSDFVGGAGGGIPEVDQTEELVPDVVEEPIAQPEEQPATEAKPEEVKPEEAKAEAKAEQATAKKESKPAKSTKVIDAIY